jgi:hypothetical protein
LPKKAAVLLIGLVIISCASKHSYSQLNRYLEKGECDRAVAYIEQNCKDYGKNNELLFLLDSAMIDFQCGRFDAAKSGFGRLSVWETFYGRKASPVT